MEEHVTTLCALELSFMTSAVARSPGIHQGDSRKEVVEPGKTRKLVRLRDECID
jgi:hypothetical protein